MRKQRQAKRLVPGRRSQFEALEGRRLLTTVVALTAADGLLTINTPSGSGVATLSGPVAVTGLGAGETLLGIDFRPLTGQLYGLGSTGQLYTLNRTTGAATAVGTPVALTGTNFGFDFNPAVDRIRVVSDAEQNLRLNPNNGVLTATDTNLAYAGTDAGVGANPNVTAAAYTNNFVGTNSTSLYVIDTDRDVLATLGSAPGVTPVVSPNGGQLFTVGALGVDATGVAGMDIAGDGNTAFAALNTAAGSSIYTVDLGTGAATSIGVNLLPALKDLSVAPQDRTLFALGSGGTSFVTFSPSNLTTPSAPVTITGVAAGETITSIDFRPATGQLFGLGSTGRVYAINPTTGVAFGIGTDVLNPAPTGTTVGIDFNPTADRLRVVTNTDQNFRVNPNDGTVVDSDTATAGTQGDTALAYAATDAGNGLNPNIADVAYTNSVAGASATTLYGVDVDRDVLVTVGSVAGATPSVSPNGGQLFTVGGLGVDMVSGGIDIGDAASGPAYLLVNAAGGTGTQLYALNLTTGAAQLIGTIGDGTQTYSDIAIGMTVITVIPATLTVAENGGTATLTVTRTGVTTGTSTVNYAATAPGTNGAAESVDFTLPAGTVTFAAGETTKTLVIPIVNDRIDESDETFTVTLSGPNEGALLGAATESAVTITDDDTAGAVSVQDPGGAQGKNAVVVTGTAGDDVIVVRKAAGNKIEVLLNGASQGTFDKKTSRVVVYAGPGDDDVRVQGTVTTSAELHGQDGDDILVGSKGRDLLIGGAGTDALFGRAGEDILIAGTTTLENTENATGAIMAVWLGKGNFAQRAAAIAAGTGVTGGFAFSAATVKDDGVRDFLTGEGSNDQFFSSAKDAISDDIVRGRATTV